jgi:hypothetical protein
VATIMNVSNAANDEDIATTNELSSSPPPTSSPSAETNESLQTEHNTASSSLDTTSELDEQPVLITAEYLPAVMQMVENLGPRRVKVYELRGEVWVDLGTGFCQGYVENVELLLLFCAYDV